MLSVVVDSPPKGRARTILDWLLRGVDHELVVLDDDVIPRDGVVLSMGLTRPFDIQVPLSKARGYRFETEWGPVVPTYDPRVVAKGQMHLMPVLAWDRDRALGEQHRPPPVYPLEQLTLVPTPAQFEAWCREASESEFIVHDIETPYSRKADEDEEEQDPSYTITRFSLGRSDSKAITAPYQEPFTGILKDFLAGTAIDRVGWNSDEFDDPREAANGWAMRGLRVDARWLWHMLQPTLPSSLAFVSTMYTRVPEWKSIGSTSGTDDELYSAMDAWATVQDYLGIVGALKGRKLR